jgi:membrane-bound inhibitor of C-type lysozyme
MGKSFANFIIAGLTVLLAGHAIGETLIEANFTCQAGKTIAATFHDNFVELQLSDGRVIKLPQTVSGSGARYANAGESMVFWNKGDTAFITEDQEETYSSCVVTK